MEERIGNYDYKADTRRKKLLLLIGALIGVVSLIGNVLVGPAWLSPLETVAALLRLPHVDHGTNVIVWTLRLPTALMAIGVGASLGVAGAGMQTILGNPLSSPYTLGISAGAGFGAALAIVTGISSLAFIGPYAVPFSAFVFATLSSLLIYSVGKARNLTAETMILAGIGLSFLFQALQSFVQYIASPEDLQSIVFWLFGSLTRANWFNLSIIYLILAFTLPLMLKDAWKLTALKLGNEKAEGLGINVERLRIKTFIMISLITAVAVSFVGTIGFIGLVGPHVARMMVGEDQRFFIPLSAIFGGTLLSISSIISKIIVPGTIFPIGIITAMVGVPFFFSLILTKKRGYFS
ncbi:FecCD family ABC transporter permease [Alkaliphilus transvaalensis]|uniref:FecCD family ABC transporter permease n=1 Tax=Alkaliphilus transvaalensis TaxID=114628 RepID=UPI00047942EB|nr:iron ABC transporter permease [Alkaliphilus transvaalensis]